MGANKEISRSNCAAVRKENETKSFETLKATRISDTGLSNVNMNISSRSNANIKIKTKVKVTNTAEVEVERNGKEVQVNQYQILEKLGSGAFSEVYKCTNRYENTKIHAIKIMSRSFLKRKKEFIRLKGQGRPSIKTALDDVEREIALMKKIHHEHIVKFYELIDDSGGDSIYLVMEFMPGGQIMYWNSELKSYSAKDDSKTTQTLSLDRSLRALRDIGLGLNYLHNIDIVHRDLKPENILLSAAGVAKIADFGVAQTLTNENDNENSKFKVSPTAGTPWFQAPEIFDREEFGSNSESSEENEFGLDVWALGVCLFAFLHGNLPFFSENIPELQQLIMTKEPILDLQKFDENDETWKMLYQVMKNCLEKHPEKRASIKDVLSKNGVCPRTKEDSNDITLTEDDITTAISVKLDFFTVVKLKMYVRRWKKRAQKNRKMLAMSSQSQTISDCNSVESGAEVRAEEFPVVEEVGKSSCSFCTIS